MSDNSVSNQSSVERSDSERIAALESQLEQVTRVTNQLIAEVTRLTIESAQLRAAIVEIFSTPLIRRR